MADEGVSNASVDPNKVARCAQHHYYNNLSRGKPRSGDEWTVYAAIVAASPSDRLHVLTCATGTKCTTVGPDGWVLRDSHAEVLCRRGLIRELLIETSQGNLRLLEKHGDSYRLRPDTSLHLYVSDSPCGDASIYPTRNKDDMNFTGAKVIVQENNTASHGELLAVHSTDNCVAREDIQQLGVLRSKSGRSNLPQHLRSACMSCSDKLMRWCLLGLQGSWLPFEIPLSSIVVSRDPNAASRDAQQQALERAICHRIQTVIEELKKCNVENDFIKRLAAHVVTVHVVEEQFPDSIKSEAATIVDNGTGYDSRNDETTLPTSDVIKKRKRECSSEESFQNTKKRRTQKSPCGVSINWQRSSGETEVVVGARGIRQGKKPKSDSDYVKMASRLSRGALMQLVNANKPENQTATYCYFKARQAHPSYTAARSLVLSTSPFKGWLTETSDSDKA